MTAHVFLNHGERYPSGLFLAEHFHQVFKAESASESVTTVTSNIKCPYCGESYYTIEHSESTCVYYPPIIKDGVNINPDRNIHTTHCRCLNCNKKFDI